jgi:hypothetical protein
VVVRCFHATSRLARALQRRIFLTSTLTELVKPPIFNWREDFFDEIKSFAFYIDIVEANIERIDQTKKRHK